MNTLIAHAFVTKCAFVKRSMHSEYLNILHSNKISLDSILYETEK